MARKTKELVEGVDYVIHRPASKKQQMILENEAQILVIGGAMGSGKALNWCTKVATPIGYKLLKDIQDGDLVLNPEGGYCTVLKAHEIKPLQAYKMTFSDGTVIDACKDHRWYGNWRADKSSPFASWDNPRCVKTTEQIYQHYQKFDKVKRKKYFRIPLTTPLEYNERDLPVDPYLLGCLLGDGTITNPNEIKITSHEDDIKYMVEAFKFSGYDSKVYHVHRKAYDIRLSAKDSRDLMKSIIKLGLYGKRSIDKFIPEDYLYSCIEDRYALLQGLMDTDGGIEDRGPTAAHRSQYHTISDELAKGFCQLASSLGYSVNKYLRPAFEKKEPDGKVYQCKPCWQIEIKSRDDSNTFRLPRKKSKIKQHMKGTWEPAITLKSIEKTEELVPMRCLTVDHPNALYVVSDGCIVTHNTYLQQMLALKYIDDPNTAVINFRRTNDEIMGPGGVWDTAYDIYSSVHPSIRPEPIPSRKSFIFPNGAKVVYKNMEHVKDARKNQGLQFTLCNFDEGTTFEWPQIEYLFQRMRSKSKYESRMVISCNPDPDHKLAEMVDWYLDEEGYPDEDKCGVIRYFAQQNGDYIWGSTKEEVGLLCDIPPEEWEDDIMSFSFIGCTIYDNPPNIKNNPKYLAWLKGMNPVDRARNLDGNWKVRPEGSKLWRRSWVRGENGERVKKMVDLPSNLLWYRGWDKGYSEPSDVNKYPDFTACSPAVGKDPETGFYYLVGNYAECALDRDQEELPDKDKIYGQFRKLAGERDSLIIQQAKLDGTDTSVVLTKDTGGAATDHTYTVARLLEHNIKVLEDKSAKNTPDKKLRDFLPFCNACEMRVVFIVEESFNNQKTLENLYNTWEAFTGAKSTGTRKDDLVDATALAFNQAQAGSKVVPIVIRRQTQSRSDISTFIDDIPNMITETAIYDRQRN